MGSHLGSFLGSRRIDDLSERGVVQTDGECDLGERVTVLKESAGNPHDRYRPHKSLAAHCHNS
ncbi:MAG: hypothetical protein ACFCVA_07910 [Gammaproteobacteria bacterium]